MKQVNIDIQTLKTLQDAGFEKGVARYSGGGDSGQVDEVEELICEKDKDDVEEIISQLCYEMLERHFGGWEIDSGSSGVFTLEMKNKTITYELNHDEEIVHTENKQASGKFSIGKHGSK